MCFEPTSQAFLRIRFKTHVQNTVSERACERVFEQPPLNVCFEPNSQTFQEKGKEGKGWDIQSIKKDSSIEVLFEGEWWACVALAVDVEDEEVFVSWVGGTKEGNDWIEVSRTRTPPQEGQSVDRNKVNSVPSKRFLFFSLLPSFFPLLVSSYHS